MPNQYRLLVRHAHQVVQVVRNGEKCLKGEAMKKVAVMLAEDGVGLSLVVDKHGKLAAVGKDNVIEASFKHAAFDKVIDASGCCILPGLVDSHTHPVWAGDRVHEFAMKLAGATYLEIHAAGGGIHFTVDKTRAASDRELLESLLKRFDNMLRSGTTLVEAKSGYGLDTETELRLLKTLEAAKGRTALEISSTYCGAHAVPKGKTMEEATQNIICEQIPEIHRLMAEGVLDVENIDVFCEKGVFDVESSRKILQAGKDISLRINFHGEELSNIGGAEMGAELGATAISHLECVSKKGIQAMGQSNTTAVILPTTAFILRLESPPVRDMIEGNVPVALGSDFNPNAYCFSMPMVMHMACVICHMSLPEALVASTINGAAALGRAETHGSLEVGKMADLLLVEAPSWEHLIYQFGSHDRIIKYVVKSGTVVHQRSN
ncbi:probable imidazolonepropionase [Ornithodoros turicata]|uniref:probable imidazolonepropionase n=1 Tax=Ornithodoros turicata TaxID=34597 RepID=UPI003138BAE6